MAQRSLEDLEREVTGHSRYFETLMTKQSKLEHQIGELKKAIYELLILFGTISIRYFIEIYFL